MIKPGVMEYEIEAELMHEFLKNRSSGFISTNYWVWEKLLCLSLHR